MDVSLNNALLIMMGAMIPALVLGIIVYFRGTYGPSRQIFIFSTLALIVWTLVNFFSLTSAHTLFWARLVLFFAIVLLFSFYLLTHNIVHSKIRRHKGRHIILLAILAFVTLTVTQTKLVFERIDVMDGAPVPVVGPAIALVALTIIALFIAGSRELLRHIKAASKKTRKALILVAIGYFAMFALLIITQFIMASVFANTSLIKFGPLFTLPFLGLTTYAIVRHRLFNIRIIATELFTGLIITATFVSFVLSTSTQDFVVRGTVFIVVTIFGIFLVRGTIREFHALEELSNAKTEFISIASHQLRTPLSVIKGYLSLLSEGSFGKMNEKHLEIIKKLYLTNEGMVRLVNDLLNVSRADQGRLIYSLDKTNIGAMINTIVSELSVNAKLKKISLVYEAPRREVLVYADADKLKQVFSNLIDNAIKYTEQGSVVVKISLEEILRGKVQISVKDTGIGIDENDMAHLFERFRRGANGRSINTSGSGLGLYISKRIIGDHKGNIWAQSPGQGKGATFIVELPLLKEQLLPQNS